MDTLMKEIETMKLNSSHFDDILLSPCMESTQKSFAPQRTIGLERQCEEADFKEFKLIMNRNLSRVQSILNATVWNFPLKQNMRQRPTEMARLGIHLLLLFGEHSEENIWNTAESVFITKQIINLFCKLFECQSIPQFLSGHEILSNLLLTLRPKLLKDTWKTYPSAVASYRWILQEAEKPILFDHIKDVLPTALLLLDDYYPDNVVIGLECTYQIIQHSHMKKGFIDCGYAKVIYHALEMLSRQKEVRYIVPLYTCMASLLATMEHWDNTINLLEWTTRDDVLSILIDNIEFEQNIELRHAYMSSLPQLITNIGCAKWCEALVRVLTESCGHHTDLRTLKATLEAAKTFLLMFHLRMATHCAPLYTAFLKLHSDLTETPVFDRAIMQNLEDCICMLYQISPDVGCMSAVCEGH